MENPPPDPGHERHTPRSREYTIWSFLAPVGALLLFIACFTAAGDSCLVKECTKTETTASDDAGPANKLKSGAKAKVKAGDTLGSLAQRFSLSQDELIACNPDVDAQTLQPGTYLNVSALDCEGQDRAETGANPDPLAGETSAVTPTATTPPSQDPTNNGTAAADPSVNGNTGAATEDTSAESGDEG